MMSEEKADNLAKGYSLGHYRILKQIGAGGMGEVFLAEDTRLRRKVALKVLPENIASDKERLRRFEQEAFAASALNHPNILTIFEFGAENETHFLATEFVEGETLREKLKNNEIGLTEALAAAEQIAFALSAAHSAGIVHRDLKPENIMIRRDGIVKLLDFGLAKLIEKKETSPDTEAETRALVKTNPGVVMGTVAYMSPEQARGKDTDERTDIWSLGVLIYEMVSGKLPFTGETTNDVIASILTREPPLLSHYVADAPAELQRIIGKILRKDRDERYQHIKDLWIDLKDLRQELEFQSKLERSAAPNTSQAEEIKRDVDTQILTADKLTGAETTAVSTKDLQAGANNSTSSAEYIVSSVKRHKTGTIIALALFVIALTGIGYGIYKWTAKENKPPLSFQNAKFTRLTITGKASGVAISPDGKYVVHIQDEGGRQSLWIRQTATTSNVQIIPPAEVVYLGLAFSPDGNYIYYTVREETGRRGTLYQMSVLGGDGKKLLTGISNSVTFSPDGKRMAFFRTSTVEGAREDALIIANADGTQEKILATRRGDERFHRGGFSDPSWSPDGKTIACPVGNFAENLMSVAAVSVETGEVRFLTSQKWFAVRDVEWMAEGDRILFNANDSAANTPYQIWQVSFSTGETRRVTNDLINYRMFSLTAGSEALAVIQGEGVASLWVMPANDLAGAMQITQGKSFNAEISWTPEGRLVYNSNINGGVDIYSIDSRGGTPKQLTANSASNSYPQVTPDGRYIVFMSDRAGRPNIWRMDLDGGNQKQLTEGFDLYPYVSPDSQWIVYQSRSGDNILRKVSIDGGKPIELTDYPSGRPVISPDGKQIAATYQENRDLPVKLAVIPFEGGAPLKTFPLLTEVETLTNGHWTNDGREIVYARTINGVSNLWAQPVDGKPPRQITNFTADRIFWFDFSSDGKQLALSRGTITGDVVLIKDFK
ncbi:MAG TPA: protein kinase [Pyrinomonadaceae bacterium]|nr:protein kinase [Pyrinomonadaceae bacterium]